VVYTVVSFHAHPDDEALLTAGTLARVVAEGHRVVLVTATDGGAGLAAGAGSVAGSDLGARRLGELHRAAAAIGCHDVRHLGYADSGLPDPYAGPVAPADPAPGGPAPADPAPAGPAPADPSPAGPVPAGPAPADRTASARTARDRPIAFSQADVDEAAGRLAQLLRQTSADVLTVYDPAGGYGHPDHVQVHRVGIQAARLAGTPVVLEATVDRRPLVRVLTVLARTGILRLLGVDRREWSPDRFARAFADPDRITHRVDTRRFAGAKRRAMAAHVTQTGADEGVRTLAVFLRLPPFVFARVFAHEWFVERGRTPTKPPLDDIFASLRQASLGDSPRRAEPD
jgi:LmbE family N-acetylglucosaminyl deacetylase